jgi:putative glutamine amidotransferase
MHVIRGADPPLVIFHPEYWAGKDRPSNIIFEAFGAAVRAHASQRAAA